MQFAGYLESYKSLLREEFCARVAQITPHRPSWITAAAKHT